MTTGGEHQEKEANSEDNAGELEDKVEADEDEQEATEEPVDGNVFLPRPMLSKARIGNPVTWSISKKDKEYIQAINSEIPTSDYRWHVGPYEPHFSKKMKLSSNFKRTPWLTGIRNLTLNNGHVNINYDASTYRDMGK